MSASWNKYKMGFRVTFNHVVVVARIVLLMGCYQSMQVWAQNDCRAPDFKNFTHKKTQYAEIRSSGNYCLNKDLKAPRVFRWTEGREDDQGGTLFFIAATQVNLDLLGRIVDKQWKGAGSAMAAGGKDAEGKFNNHVTIKNGTLINRTGNGFISSYWDQGADWPLLYKYAGYAPTHRMKQYQDPWEKLYNFSNEEKKRYDERAAEVLVDNKITWHIDRADLKPFLVTGHRLENLRIDAAGSENNKPDWKQDLYATSGIEIRGAQNVIRNCTIEVTNTDAGIYLFGPKQIIENNTIIFKGHLPQGMSAPIRLSLGDGSIIRNNTIIVKSSGADKPAAAISLIDSRGVILENNVIRGVDALYKAWDEVPEQKTTVVDKGNQIKAWWQVF